MRSVFVVRVRVLVTNLLLVSQSRIPYLTDAPSSGYLRTISDRNFLACKIGAHSVQRVSALAFLSSVLAHIGHRPRMAFDTVLIVVTVGFICVTVAIFLSVAIKRHLATRRRLGDRTACCGLINLQSSRWAARRAAPPGQRPLSTVITVANDEPATVEVPAAVRAELPRRDEVELSVRSALAALPEKTWRAAEQESADCSLCLEPLAEGQRVRTLACQHQFHTKCIDRWLGDAQAHQRRRCPLCNADPIVTVSIQCPVGAGSGDPVRVQHLDGQAFDVTVPPGVSPGENFHTTLPGVRDGPPGTFQEASLRLDSVCRSEAGPSPQPGAGSSSSPPDPASSSSPPDPASSSAHGAAQSGADPAPLSPTPSNSSTEPSTLSLGSPRDLSSPPPPPGRATVAVAAEALSDYDVALALQEQYDREAQAAADDEGVDASVRPVSSPVRQVL